MAGTVWHELKSPGGDNYPRLGCDPAEVALGIEKARHREALHSALLPGGGMPSRSGFAAKPQLPGGGGLRPGEHSQCADSSEAAPAQLVEATFERPPQGG